jgi:hypothetical protein
MDAFTDTINLTGQQFIPMPASSIQAVYEFKDPKEQPGGKQYNVAFIKLNNETNSLVQLQTTHSVFIKNTRGLYGTNRGDSDVYELSADQGAAGRIYSTLGIQHDSGELAFEPKTVIPGHEYAVNITQLNGIFQYAWTELGLKSEVENNEIFLNLE